MDGITVKIASMSVREAEDFVAEGDAFLEQMKSRKVEAKEWLSRRNRAVVASLLKAVPDSGWTEDRLKDEFDLQFLDALYTKILAFSGLKPGEVVAASPLPKSAAA
jgi:hypothetical protein